jgi:hypothetical protein
MVKKKKTSPEDLLRTYEADYTRIKAAIQQVGFICTGSLAERWLTCGNANCRCHHDPSLRHGPYHQLSWKQDGKTVSRFISPQIAEFYRQWIDNRRSLDAAIAQMHAISEKAQECILPPDKKKSPSKKSRPSMPRRAKKSP